MKTSKLLLVAALGLAAVAYAGQDTVTLQRVLTENASETYKVESKVDQTVESPLGEMPMNVTTAMTYEVKTGKVDADKTKMDVEVTMKVDKLDADGPLGGQLAQQKINPVVEKGTLDKFGHMTLTVSGGSDPMALAMSGAQSTESTMFVEFPDHPVKVGDSWDIKVPKSMFTGPDDQTITAKLVGDKVVDGHNVWLVDISGKIKMTFDTSKLPSPPADSGNPLANLKYSYKGSLDITGEGSVDKTSGQTLLMTTTGKLESNIQVIDHDFTIQGTGTIKSTLKLQS